MPWSAAEFQYQFERLPDVPQQQRALDDLTAAQRKLRKEWLTFLQFSSVAQADIDPRTVENREPPEPDIYCERLGRGHYFELGEITDQSIPRNEAEANRYGDGGHGGPISQIDPLEKMVFAKCRKSYVARDLPIDLVLHFSVGHHVPNVALLDHWLTAHRTRVYEALAGSPFGAIWFFNGWTNEVLRVIQRTTSR